MKLARVLLVLGLFPLLPLRAVYAPVPDQEVGKDLVVTLRAGATHDSNIFGAQAKTSTSPATQPAPLSSEVYTIAPKIAYSGSLNDQTFASLSYALTLDHFTERPGEKNLDSHDITARLAHAFSSATNIDISDEYLVSKNPESLLPGVTSTNPLTLNTEQSFKRNALDARFDTTLTEKTGVSLKFRSMIFRFDDAVLASKVDRTENLAGLSGSYALVPEMKLVGEYRRESITYVTSGANKDKHSDFAIAGFDYNVAKKLSSSVRFGYTWRHRDGERSAASPHAEVSAKYDYAPRSFITTGYVFTFQEISNVDTYTDTKVNRLFLNIQHAIGASLVASGSFSYEPSLLQRRRNQPGDTSVSELTTRFGLALTWLAQKNWSVSASYDNDNINSDDASRGQQRTRIGVNVSYTF